MEIANMEIPALSHMEILKLEAKWKINI